MEQNNQHNQTGIVLQQPLNSGFDAHTTAQEIIQGIDLSNKVAIVTGGNTGIGLETTKILAGAGATVIVVARDVGKAARNLSGIPGVEIEAMDCMQPGTIDSFAEKFMRSGRPLHILINNAGIMWVPLRRDARGIESQLATNYLGQFHLTAKLWPALVKAQGARVVNLSSLGHQLSGFDFSDPNFLHRDYQTLTAYGQSKTATNLFTVELDRWGSSQHVRAYAVHPGSIAGTELGREASLELFQQMGFLDEYGNLRPEVAAGLKTIPQGAATSVWCAAHPQLSGIGGVYCEDCDIAALLTDAEPGHANGVQSYSLDPVSALRLWGLSEEMSGVKFPIH